MQNEVDVIAARNNRLVFISAKNGRYYNDEIYKLGTVRARLGGKYSRTVLFASQDAAKYKIDAVKLRAKELNIFIFKGAENEQICRNLRSLLP